MPAEPHGAGEVRVTCHDHAAVAGAAHDLARREGEERGITERPGGSATIRRAERQRRILDHQQIVAPSDLDDRIELGGKPVHVDGHDRPRPRRNRRLDQVWIEVIGRWVDVDEDEA